MSIPVVVSTANVAKDLNVMQLNVSILMNAKKELPLVALKSHVLTHLAHILVNVQVAGHVMVWESVSITTNVSPILMIVSIVFALTLKGVTFVTVFQVWVQW